MRKIGSRSIHTGWGVKSAVYWLTTIAKINQILANKCVSIGKKTAPGDWKSNKK